MDERALYTLIDRMYSAALGYEDASAVLAKSAHLAGFATVGVVVVHGAGEQGRCVASSGIDMAAVELAEKKYAVSNKVSCTHCLLYTSPSPRD